MYALHLTHPGPSFLQDPPGAVGSFSAPVDQVNRPSRSRRMDTCSVFACFSVWGSYWRKPLVNTGRTCKLHTERHDGSPLGDSSPSHCACVILRHCRQRSRARMRHNDRSIFNHGGKKRRKPVLSKHDHLFKNKEDVVTVDKTDEVEDQKVSPQFRFIC